MTRARSIPATLAIAATAFALVAVGGAPKAEAADCSSPPTISGTEAGGFARYNAQLTGMNHCTVFVGGSTSREWFSCTDPAVSATCDSVGNGSTYTPVVGDIGKFIKLVESADDLSLMPHDESSAATGRVKGRSPTAAFTRSAATVKRGVTVTFNGGGSSDPDGQTLTYEWDLNGNNAYNDADDATGPTASTSFASAGTKTIRLRVTDTDGDSNVVSHTVKVTPTTPPTATFVFTPSAPVVGTDVTFTSTSSDADADPLSYAWDLDGDGAYDDGTGKVVHHVYAAARTYEVGLRVIGGGDTTTGFRTVDVDPKPTVSPPPTGGGGTKKPKKKKLKLLRPFPKVAMGGFITSRGVRLKLLGVVAPRGSKVMIKCRGHGCPRRTTRKRMRKKKLFFASFLRSFRAGAVIRVYVWKKNRIGKYTTFRIRRNRRPARRDRCLDPNKLKPRRCPR